ncbi:MAG: ACT domain-containing protein [Emcibacteraceae bacterium]|nr:ACT domain-containing protein [Emcibacteraceae bacterium]
MTGILDLETLLKNMEPSIGENDFVYCTLDVVLNDVILSLDPDAIIKEAEGLTLILKKDIADKNLLEYEGVYKKITLNVHSSLEAIGLTAAFSKALTNVDISANVVAGFYHDHIFVPEVDVEKAFSALKTLSE